MRKIKINKQLLLKSLYVIGLITMIGGGLILFFFKDELIKFTQDTSSASYFVDYELKGEGKYLSGVVARLYNPINLTEIKTKKDIIINFCDGILNVDLKDKGNTKTDYMRSEDSFYYNPGASIFMYNLCNYGASDEDGKSTGRYKGIKSFNLLDDVITQDSFEGVKGYQYFDDCYPDSDLQDCEVVQLMSKTFRDIINEYSNLKLVSLFGVRKKDASYEELAKAYSNSYFGPCGDGKVYISDEPIEDKNNQHCSHPKTAQLLMNTMRDLNELLSDFYYIDLYKFDIPDGEKGFCNIGKGTYDFFKCGLQSSNVGTDGKGQNGADWRGYRNIVLNELMYYKLFVNYYLFLLSGDPGMQSLSVTDIQNKLRENSLEIDAAKKELQVIHAAVLNHDITLKNVLATYSLHIGLMAYYEDIVKFRDKFVKIYTPISQMYYKFRNVQDRRK